MYRVTNDMMKDTMLYNYMSAARRVEETENQIATGKKARMPNEDPSGTINSMRYKSRLTELKQFQDNVLDGDSRLKFYETALESTGDIMLRLKELAVQASNGVLNEDDRKIAASEVEQLLRQMVQVANARYRDESIFSGFRTTEDPFRVTEEKLPGSADRVLTKVEYVGDIGVQLREIEQQQYVGVNLVGNKVFWGSDMRVSSSTPGTDYKAVKDQVFRIGGTRIDVKAGDTLPVIAQKINAANLPVHASIDNTKGANLLVLETTDPHQLWVEDIEGGRVMQDLGVIAEGSHLPPKNWSPTANVRGNSLFDQVIGFRDALLANDAKKLGGKVLGDIDAAIKHIARYRGELGALEARLDSVQKRLYTDEVNMTDILSKTEDVDMAEAITNLRMLENAQKSTLQVGARIIPQTLLDFLR